MPPEDRPPTELTASATDARRPGIRTAALQQLQRFSWRSVVQLTLLIVAATVLVNKVAGLDLATLGDELRDATWWLVAVAFVLAQSPRLTQAVSALGASPQRLPFRAVYLLQLTLSYIGLAVPSSAARIAVNVRFFQKQGFSSGSALAIGALDSLGGFAVEATLLAGLLAFTPSTLHFDLEAPSLADWTTILWALVAIAVVVAIVTMLIPARRRQATEWLRGLAKDGMDAAHGLRSPRRLGLLIGGNLATILLFSTTLGLIADALGTRVTFADLVVVVISVSLLAGLLPVPGGIGVVESGLTFGLVAAGMPEEPAFACALLYRVATFYLPPIWGYLAFRSLERSDLL